MKKPLKAFTLLIALIVIAFAGLAFVVGTLNADKYRSQLVEVLSKKTGRTVKLNGPIAFSLGFKGMRVSIQDASISNPAWGSRGMLAGMGKLELGLDVLPLLARRLEINALLIENADILLETNAAGQHNWDINLQAAVPVPAASSSSSVSSSPSASIKIDSLSIVNSQLALRGVDGKISSANIASLKLGMRGAGAELNLTGDINGAPITVDLKTGITDLLSKEPFSFDADATFNTIHLAAQGKADIGGGKADIAAYEVTAGKTKITGDLTAIWSGPRPTLRGALKSDTLNPADFTTGTATTGSSETVAPAEPQAARPKRMFSDAPLPLKALKAVDTDLTVVVGEFPVGKAVLKQIEAKFFLSNGNLTLAPVKAKLGDSPVELQVKLNAAQNPAHATVGVIADEVDLGDLQQLGSMSPFLTGKASANIQLAGDGNSAHDIASSLGGVIVVTAGKGEVLTGAASNISSLLAALFNAKKGDSALNCLAMRFIAKNGVLNDNGILIDSAASTVAGTGSVNLGSETVNMMLLAKSKLINIGGLAPSLQIGGSLSKPSYSVDAEGMVKNVIGSLVNGSVEAGDSGVPEIQEAPAGQNACVYTLNHPKKAASTGILSTNPIGTATQKIENIGNSLLKGLLGQ